MQEISFGQLLETIRIQKFISKTSLARGLCSVSTLSRYESDLFLPDKFIAECLLERLGINPDIFDFVLSEKNYKIAQTRTKIKECLAMRKWNEISSLLDEYQDLDISTVTHVHEQYILLQRSNILINVDHDYAQAKQMCLKALQLTKCPFAVSKRLGNTLLSAAEIELYNNLFYVSFLTEDTKLFSHIYALEKYLVKQNGENSISSKYLPFTYYIIALHQKQIFNFKQCRDYLVMAKDLLISNYSTNYLLEILQLQLELENLMNICTENEIILMRQMVVALKMLDTRQKNNLLSNEGIQIWENTANQTLF